MNKFVAAAGVLVVIVVMVVGGAFYQVDETELVIITQFGEPVGEAITTPGLKIKAPFIHRVRRFEKRILEWDGSPDEIPTLDKRFIKLDTTARWRIVDPLQFLKAVKTERSAQSRLDDLIDSAARDVGEFAPADRIGAQLHPRIAGGRGRGQRAADGRGPAGNSRHGGRRRDSNRPSHPRRRHRKPSHPRAGRSFWDATA